MSESNLIKNFKSITIKDALDSIENRTYLLPAIQRKFVWKTEQIERLFDSILRGYPINIFMLWKVTDSKIKKAFSFYDFIQEYQEDFKEDNPRHKTSKKEFYAVIDGQQRLTSLYIGLLGTYAYKLPNVWRTDSEKNYPKRKLYLDLSGDNSDENDERAMIYNFKFLSESEYEYESKKDDKYEWFCLNNLFNYKSKDEFTKFVYTYAWKNPDFARTTLVSLYEKIFVDFLIIYNLEEEQDVEKVFEIFVRTNGGGSPLTYSDLLMSFIAANWDDKKDIRDEFKKIITFVRDKCNFDINKDFILRTCLVLFSKSIQLRIKIFKSESDIVSNIQDNWDRISDCICQAFTLIKRWGFDFSNLKSMNAVIPIIYYIYTHNIEKTINDSAKHLEEKKEIRKWFILSLLKQIFSGQSNYVLGLIRSVIDKTIKESRFPLGELKNKFKTQTRNLEFDDDYIDQLLSLHKDDPLCYSVLAILFSNSSNIDFENQKLNIDHLHPASYFKNLKEKDFESKNDYDFYKNKDNWDTIPNLQLLNETLNRGEGGKFAMSLKDWIEEVMKDDKYQFDYCLIPKDVSLDVKNFKDFIIKRKVHLKDLLIKAVQ